MSVALGVAAVAVVASGGTACAGGFSSANPARPGVRVVDFAMPPGDVLPEPGAGDFSPDGLYVLIGSQRNRNAMRIVRVADRRVVAQMRGVQGAVFTGPREIVVALQPKRLEDHVVQGYDPMCNPGRLVRVDLRAGTVQDLRHGKLRRGETTVPVSGNVDGRLVMRRMTADSYGTHCRSAGFELLNPATGERERLA